MELLDLEGMTIKLVEELGLIGIYTIDDLAEVCIDDIENVPGMSHKLAGDLIIRARHVAWFN